MPRLMSFVAAEGVAIDQLTSRVTAFNMIDHFMLPSLPARVVRVAALSQYELIEAAESFGERVRLITPDGEVAAISESTVELPSRAPAQLPNGHRSVHVLWAPVLKVAGDYRLLLEQKTVGSDWTAIASLRITALVQQHPILNAQSPSVPRPTAPASVAPASDGATSGPKVDKTP